MYTRVEKKIKKKQQMSLLFRGDEIELLKRTKDMAKAEGRSWNKQIIQLLKEAMNNG